MNRRKTVWIIGTLIILGVVFLAFNVNFQRPEQAGAAPKVVGQGTPRFLAKWVSSIPPGGFTLSQGALQCNTVGLTWTAPAGASGYRVLKGDPRVTIATTTALAYTDYDVTQNQTYKYQIEAFNASGDNRSNAIDVTTPFCPPTVDLKCNGSDGPVPVATGGTCSLTWTSTDTSGPTPCTASGGWTGQKAPSGGPVISSPINNPTAFTLVCTGPGGSTAPLDSVQVNPTGPPLPSWREIIPQP